MKKLQILIADDHPIFRLGLKEILVDEIKEAQFTEVENAEQALALVRKQKWDALILDVNMPGRTGFEILSDVKLARPEMPVLILSAASEDQYGVRVLKAGASGFVNKLRAPQEIAAAVRQILEGELYISAATAKKLASAVSRRAAETPHEKLSDREMEVLTRIGAGKGTKEIASDLSISAQTVSTYRSRILEKLGAKTTADLIRYTIDHHLLEH
jgi:two-component system invasion response regulator UvrY